MDRVKVGLVGFAFPNFSAKEFGIWPRAIATLASFSSSLDFELHHFAETIASRNDAEMARRELDEWGADFILIQVSSFALGDLLDPFITETPRLGLWAVPEPIREGPLALNSLTAFNLYASKMRLSKPQTPFKWFYGDGTELAFQKRLAVTIRALAVLKTLQGAQVALLGGIAPTFDNLQFDPGLVRSLLGVSIVEDSLDEVFARARAYPTERVAQAAQEILASVRRNDLPHAMVEQSARIYLALSDVAEANRYSAMAVSCWPRFQEVMQIAPCAAYAWLNQMGMTIADEGDALGAVSMLALRAASMLPTTMMDLVAVDDLQDQIHFWHCGGPTAPMLADQAGARLAYHPTLDRAQPADAPRRGAAMDLVMRPGSATIMRLTGSAKDMFLLSADIVEKPTRGYEGSRGWFGNLRINGAAIKIPDLLETMVYYGIEHHYPIAFMDVELIMREVAAWLGLRVLAPITYTDCLQNPIRDPIWRDASAGTIGQVDV